MCKIEDVLNIISSDEQFLRYICISKSFTKYEIRTIPRKSFTGFRLTYATPWEISLASKTILLGGIPKYWYEEQQSRFLKFFTRCYTRRLRKRVRILTFHGYKRIYDKNIYTITRRKPKLASKKKLNISKLKLLKNTGGESDLSKFDYNRDISPYIIEHKNKKNGRFELYSDRKVFRRHSTGTLKTGSSKTSLSILHPKRPNTEKLSTKTINGMFNIPRYYFRYNTTKNWLDTEYAEVRKRKRERGQHYKKGTSKYSNLNELNNIINKYNFLNILKPIGEKTLSELPYLNHPLSVINNDEVFKYEEIITKNKNGNINLLQFKNKTRAITTKCQYNKLLSDDLLILQKIGLINTPPNMMFNENENIDTRIEEHWSEYFAVLSETKELFYPLFIMCYKKGNHKGVANVPDSCKPTLVIPLNSSSVLNFYSLLDKTIAIQNAIFIQDHAGSKRLIKHIEIFILQCKLTSTSFKWFNTLNQHFEKSRIIKHITVKIPEIKLVLNIKLDLVIFRFLEMMEEQEKNTVKLVFSKSGLYVFPCQLVRYLRIVILKKLIINSKMNQFQNLSNFYSTTGCNMRINDRFEYYSKNDTKFLKNYLSLVGSHQLEYRSWAHYPYYPERYGTQIIEEPIPVEGFLVKINCDNDICFNAFKKKKVKLYYFFTSDNLLFCTSSYKCSPLLPRNIRTDRMGCVTNIISEREKLDKIPLVYKQNPYYLRKGPFFKWLSPASSNERFKSNDYFAFKYYHTKLLRILKSDSIIDINNIKNITMANKVNSTTLESLTYMYYSFWKKRNTVSELKHCLIKIIMKNGSNIYLMGPTTKIAKMWSVTLNKMIHYWNHKRLIDKQNTKIIQTQNLKQKDVDKETVHSSTQLTSSIEDISNKPSFNMNGISLLRSIIQSGMLFQKVRKHSSFHKYFVILIPGFIMLFSLPNLSKKNFLYQYEHYQTISIDNCYVYSGTACSSNLIDDAFSFDSANPGYHATPNLFEDDWNSVEENITRCFSIHFGKKDSIRNDYNRKYREAKTRDNKENFKIYDRLTNKNRIKTQFHYKTMTFMAKSKKYRDIWLLALQQELERLNKHE